MLGGYDRYVTTVLRCQACDGERPHRVRLGREGIVETSCTACGRTLAVPQRRSARLALGPFVLGGGAPMLVHGRVPSGIPAGELGAAVGALAAAGCHVVEIEAGLVSDPALRRIVSEVPVAFVADAGRRLVDACRLVADPALRPAGGVAAVRWVYDGSLEHFSLLWQAAVRRGVPLWLAVPLDEVPAAGAASAVARAVAAVDDAVTAAAGGGGDGEASLVLEFTGTDPAKTMSAYAQAAERVSCPLHARFPRRWLAGEAGEEVYGALSAFVRARLCDCVGASVDDGLPSSVAGDDHRPGAVASDDELQEAVAGAAAVRRLLQELWLPVAPAPPRVEVTVQAHPDGRKAAPASITETLLAAASAPARVAERVDPLAVAALPLRALTKPVRLWHEMRRDGAGVLLTMPRRVATKPLRLMRELSRSGRQA